MNYTLKSSYKETQHEYRKQHIYAPQGKETHARFTENALPECFRIMDELFELKRIALMEQKEYQNLLPWCRAHEKLLPRYDSFFENVNYTYFSVVPVIVSVVKYASESIKFKTSYTGFS